MELPIRSSQKRKKKKKKKKKLKRKVRFERRDSSDYLLRNLNNLFCFPIDKL